MQRALILLNPCGREAGRHKLKNGLKTQKMHFLPVFELTLASLTAIWVEQNQCLLHQSILLSQGPINEIKKKKDTWELVILKYSFFWVTHYGIFFQKKIVLLHPHENRSKPLGYQEWVKSLMITLVYSKRVKEGTCSLFFLS